MRYFKKYVALSIIFFLITLLATTAYSLTKRQAAKVKRNTTSRSKYVKKHDLNNDGRVNATDKAILADKKTQDTLVSTEHEGVNMDMDGDGDVEDWEIEGFYSKYDVNEDGVLDSYELSIAKDE